MNLRIGIVWPILVLAGCTDPNQANVVFGQSHVLGVAVGTSTTGATPEVTVGYKDANIAILPTNATTDGVNYKVRGATNKAADGSDENDTYSTFGQFEGTVEGGKVGLNKFFATGIAAQRLSEGFACAVSEGRSDEHCHSSTTHTLSEQKNSSTNPQQPPVDGT